MTKFGITNVLIVLSLTLDTIMDVIKAKKNDGKINLRDYPMFIDNLARIPGAIRSAPLALKEALDFDGDEAEQVAKMVIEKTGVSRESVKSVIIDCIGVVKSGAAFGKDVDELIGSIKALKDSD